MLVCCDTAVGIKKNLPVYIAADGKTIDQSLKFIAYSAITLGLTFQYLPCASWKCRKVNFKGALISVGLKAKHTLRRWAEAWPIMSSLNSRSGMLYFKSILDANTLTILQDLFCTGTRSLHPSQMVQRELCWSKTVGEASTPREQIPSSVASFPPNKETPTVCTRSAENGHTPCG